MVIDKFEKYNESIRDLMTPVPEDELEAAYKRVFVDSSIRLDKYKNKTPGEFKQLSEKIGEPLDKLYFISEEETSEFETVHNLFTSILNKLTDEEYGVVFKTKKDGFYGDWYCYPDIPLAYWFDDDDVHAWIFSEKTFKNND
jgi:hypothetical protein